VLIPRRWKWGGRERERERERERVGESLSGEPLSHSGNFSLSLDGSLLSGKLISLKCLRSLMFILLFVAYFIYS